MLNIGTLGDLQAALWDFWFIKPDTCALSPILEFCQLVNDFLKKNTNGLYLISLPWFSPQPHEVCTIISSILQMRIIEAQKGLSDSPRITWPGKDECPVWTLICLNLWYLKMCPASWERQEMGKCFLRNHVPESFMPLSHWITMAALQSRYFNSLDL